MIFSIARRTAMRPMSAQLRLPTRAAFMSRRMKDPSTYEHVTRKASANRTILADQAGKSTVLDRFMTAEIEVDAKDPAIDRILREVKDKEWMVIAMMALVPI